MSENPYIQAGKDFVGNVIGVDTQVLPAPGAAERLCRYAYYITETQKNAGDAMLVFDLHEAVKALESASLPSTAQRGKEMSDIAKIIDGSWRAHQQEDGDWEVRAIINEQDHYVLIAFDLSEDVARLIAAAPDMLAGLKTLVSDIIEYERINNLSPSPGKKDCWQSVTSAKAIIAKAESASLSSPDKTEDDRG